VIFGVVRLICGATEEEEKRQKKRKRVDWSWGGRRRRRRRRRKDEGQKEGKKKKKKKKKGGGRKKNYNAGDSPNNCLEGSSDTLSPTLFTVLRTTRPISEYFGCLIEKSTFFVAFFPFYPHHHATSHVTCHHLLTAEMTSD